MVMFASAAWSFGVTGNGKSGIPEPWAWVIWLLFVITTGLLVLVGPLIIMILCICIDNYLLRVEYLQLVRGVVLLFAQG